MDFDTLLQTKECRCGRTHACAVKKVIVEKDAIAKLDGLLGGYRHILLAADSNTYPVCGQRVRQTLGGRLEKLLVYETGDEVLIPNEAAIERMEACVTGETDLIIGVGSGVMQDLCKYVSFRAGLPYDIVATAPSMDGYASAGAAMLVGNMKVTYDAHVPEVILGDVEVLRDAPMEMIVAGYGDILGKFSCLNDWKLSALVNGEYICPEVYGLVQEMLDKVKDLGPDLLRRDRAAVQTLTQALVGVGIAMAFVGNSRPASGSEHHMSHFFEVVGILNHAPYFPHGIDVAYSAVCTQRLREALLQMDLPAHFPDFDEAAWEKNIQAVYGPAAEGVLALQKKAGRHRQDKDGLYREKWGKIKEILAQTPSSGELERYLASVGLSMEDFEKMYGAEKIQNAVRFAKDLKDRYTVLWLYDAVIPPDF